jgi:hypothetical protein
MSDNSRRALRTAIQGLIGFAAAGGLNEVWQNYLSNHDTKIDSTLLFIIGLLLTGAASWAQNAIEDATGKGILIAKDRKIGDQALGTGVGAKTG